MPSYAQGHSAAMMASHQSRSASNCCAYFLPLLESRPSARILDVGCGPGTITTTLAPLVPQGEVIGIDYSEEAIKAASAQSEVPSNCSFQVANLDTALPFPDNTFDVVHTHQVLLHLSEPIPALVEMRRVCKPGGFIASRECDIGTTAVFPELPELCKFHDVYNRYIRASGAETKGGRYLRYWALQAGFRDDRITYTSTPILYSGREQTQWWAKVQADRFGGEEMAQKFTSKGYGTKEDVESFGKAWLEWGEHPGAVFMMGCGEVVCWKD